MQTTNYDFSMVAKGNNTYEDNVITFGGADTLVKGTIIARNTSTLKLQIYAKGGVSNGNGVPVGVLENEVVATGAGDVACRPIMTGIIDSSMLIIDADGDGSNVDATVLDLLRQTGLEPKNFQELVTLGNQ